jgi:tetratricopeptide (TPR) repeat protein
MTTNTLLEEIESNLAEYRPDMVVAMMGINDKGKHMPPEPLTASGKTPFIRMLRIYKLARLLCLHLQTKFKEMGFYKPDTDTPRLGRVQTPVPEIGSQNASAGYVLADGSDETPVEQKRIHRPSEGKHDPGKAQTPLSVSELKGTPFKFVPAEGSFKKAAELDCKIDSACVDLARLSLEQGNLQKAESLFKKAIAINSKSDAAYEGLGELYLKQFKYTQAEDSCRKVFELTQNVVAYIALEENYRDRGEFQKSEDLFMEIIKSKPNSGMAYCGLGQVYQIQGKLVQAEEAFKKSLDLCPAGSDFRIFAFMSTLYGEMGKPELAKECFERARQMNFGEYFSVTADNYHRLKHALDKRGIRLVCVQYPMHNVEPLKRIFAGDTSVIFVDNEKIFKDAVSKGSYKEYFRDMFGGDFGHCTPKGNELLAQNIADVILKKVFNR